MSYSVLERAGLSQYSEEHEKMALPYVWSYLSYSDIYEGYNEGDMLFNHMTGGSKKIIFPMNYDLYPIQEKNNNVDLVEMVANKPTLACGHLVGLEDKELIATIAKPDTMLVDSFNQMLVSSARGDIDNAIASFQVMQSLMSIYILPMLSKPKKNIPSGRIKPYVL